MSPETETFKELDSLIRAAYAELGKLQLHLIEAHERELSPAELGIHIADLGYRISTWKRERESLSRSLSALSKPTTDTAPDGGFPQKASSIATRSRHASSPQKDRTRVADRQNIHSHSANAACAALI
jgi:hypothetical protein